MADDSDRMRQLRDRLGALQRENESPPHGAHTDRVSPVQSGRTPGRLRSAATLLLLVVGVLVILQTGFTLTSLSGHDFKDARRVGQATVEACERRGPIGLIYGYWDDCTVSIKWNDGVPEYGRLGEPHLFTASEVGTTVEIGDNGTSKNGPTYSRPTFPPRPPLAAIGTILFVIGAIPGIMILWVLWHLLRNTLSSAIRGRR